VWNGLASLVPLSHRLALPSMFVARVTTLPIHLLYPPEIEIDHAIAGFFDEIEVAVRGKGFLYICCLSDPSVCRSSHYYY